MSLELPSQRTQDDEVTMRFTFEGRKVAFRGTPQSQERIAQVIAIETAVATGQITLDGMSVTTDLL